MLIKDYVAVDSHLINTTVMSFLVNKKIKFINRPAALLLRLIFPLFKIKYLISKLGLIKTIKRLITNPRLLSIFPKNLNIFKSIFNKKQTYDVVTPATED